MGFNVYNIAAIGNVEILYPYTEILLKSGKW